LQISRRGGVSPPHEGEETSPLQCHRGPRETGVKIIATELAPVLKVIKFTLTWSLEGKVPPSTLV